MREEVMKTHAEQSAADLAVLRAYHENEKRAHDRIDQLIAERDAMRETARIILGRLQNVSFDLRYGNVEQAMDNAGKYIRLSKEELAVKPR
jgi:hypothetical protein